MGRLDSRVCVITGGAGSVVGPIDNAFQLRSALSLAVVVTTGPLASLVDAGTVAVDWLRRVDGRRTEVY